MNKIIRLIQSYLMIGLPFIFIFMLWNTIHPQKEILSYSSNIKILFGILAVNLMLWFAVLIVFLIMLVLIPRVREQMLSRLANLKERDEREEYITGKASRASYISTLSLMILFLFFSIFSLNIYKLPKEQTVDGKHQVTIGIGLHFNLLDNQSRIEKNPQGEVLFESQDIPLSKTAIILIFLGWQLLSFNLVARRIKNDS